MPTKIVRHEFYNENGLLEVHEVEVEDTLEDLIQQKEDLLLQMYNEIQDLKKNRE